VTYIAVEGVIGVGKTTLARLLQPEFDAQLLLEVFEENPFLSDFYHDRSRYAFQTQIFFLLSRYRQQQMLVPLIEAGTVLSDYVFGKDCLFAQENLTGDELRTYERLYAALSVNVPQPDLVVYLYAETDVLMDRIAIRDRSYERNMSRDYVEGLRQAYERFFDAYTESPVIRIDCSALDFVRKSEDLALVTDRIRSVLEEGTHQRLLRAFAGQRPSTERRDESQPQGRCPVGDRADGARGDAYLELIRLQQSLGSLAGRLLQIREMEQILSGAFPTHGGTLSEAISCSRAALERQLADCLVIVSRLAGALGIDLPQASGRRPRPDGDDPGLSESIS